VHVLGFSSRPTEKIEGKKLTPDCPGRASGQSELGAYGIHLSLDGFRNEFPSAREIPPTTAQARLRLLSLSLSLDPVFMAAAFSIIALSLSLDTHEYHDQLAHEACRTLSIKWHMGCNLCTTWSIL
jgi:hypothetical protein